MAEKGTYIWGNGRPVVFTNFRYFGLEVPEGDCLVTFQNATYDRYLWDIRDCRANNYFICEREIVENCPPGPPPPPTFPPTLPPPTFPPTTIGPPTPPPFGVIYELITTTTVSIHGKKIHYT